MTKKQRWVYWCDFCGKSGRSGGHIGAHEKACTANPDRICRMHKHCDQPQRTVPELMAILRSHCADKDWSKALIELREAASECPACMLAAIRQSGMQKATFDSDGVDPGVDFGFDFKKELASFWSTVNDAAYQEEMAHARY